jgi:hypothetical protein
MPLTIANTQNRRTSVVRSRRDSPKSRETTEAVIDERADESAEGKRRWAVLSEDRNA